MELHLECDRTPRSNSKIHTYINLDQRIPSAIYIFKVSKKHTRRMCQIYSKLVIKTPEQHLVLLLLTLNTFSTLFYCQYCWIQTDIYIFFLIGIHPMQGWTTTTRHGVTRKEAQKEKPLIYLRKLPSLHPIIKWLTYFVNNSNYLVNTGVTRSKHWMVGRKQVIISKKGEKLIINEKLKILLEIAARK